MSDQWSQPDSHVDEYLARCAHCRNLLGAGGRFARGELVYKGEFAVCNLDCAASLAGAPVSPADVYEPAR